MLENLKLRAGYDGFLYLADAARNPPLLKPHHHVELELNLVVRGTITYIVNGLRYAFRTRTLLWLFPEQEHQLVDRSDDAQTYVVVFTPTLIQQSCRTSLYEGLQRPPRDRRVILNTVLEPSTFDLVRKTMESLTQGGLSPDLLNREAGFGVNPAFSFEHGDVVGLNAGLHHLLLLCWRSRETGKSLGEPVALHPAVSRAVKLLSEKDWNRDFASLAKACRVSEAHLSRTFHQQIGLSLGNYRNSLRLSRFWEHYRQPTHTTLTEAVYAAGFGSYAQFYKVFVQAYGRGPRQSIAESRGRSFRPHSSAAMHDHDVNLPGRK